MEHFIDLLIDPSKAFTNPNPTDDRQPDLATKITEVITLARTFHAEHNWAELAHVYQTMADLAWKQGRKAASIRLLLAERAVALRLGDDDRVRQATYFAGQRHRLSASFLAAEGWNRSLLRTQLTERSARTHVAAWRELAAIAEFRSDYRYGLESTDRALAICGRFTDDSEMANERVKVLLQAAVLQRQRGAVDLAVDALEEARRLAAETECGPLTRGLIELRDAGLQVVIGRPEAALAAYRRAEALFSGVSENNEIYTLIRQVACLRGMHRSAEALETSARVLRRIRRGGERYRVGQVLLEQAEVYQDMGDHEGVRRTLDEAAHYYERATGLEALRWHRHRARHLIETGGDPSRAAHHLRTVLRHACTEERADLTRTMLALHDLARLPDGSDLPFEVRLAASRAALLAADLQRASLSEPIQRWSMHGLREDVYSGALLLHAVAGDSTAVVQIAETGRTDMLNQLIASGAPAGSQALTDLPLIPQTVDEDASGAVFEIAGLLAEGARDLQAGSVHLPGEAVSHRELDGFADIVVTTHLGSDGAAWWASSAMRPRGGQWSVVITQAADAVAGVLNRLASGALLPPNGVAASVWEELGSFLLPQRDAWSGDRDAPISIMICPDPRLWHLPHGALTRAGRSLAEGAEVTLAPSLNTLRLLRERERHRDSGHVPPRARTAVSVLDTRLTGYAVESRALESWPGGHRTLGGLTAFPPTREHGLLYVSGHGDGPGARSALGPTNITLDTLARQHLPPLVVLNGCWSGTADSRYGQDPLSLAVGGLLGGAATVIAGIGRIDGMASAHIAALMLVQVMRGVPATSALRAAQLRVREEHPELGPFGWAGLCSVGTGR
ncbi:hypothetical protein GCM10010402_41220 [Actinomadura luteofluorescens]|uniref:CHAT domain-containing protein n=1 Tax=Actinomadura luteofluorescens TaxID=46163 RepID=UPI00216461EE|nr:CHAT domain-containing protein [Actinomadura glauciflava]MCR3742635.1 CHAT domain-containing protein [Actinomadura glauciflava]